VVFPALLQEGEKRGGGGERLKLCGEPITVRAGGNCELFNNVKNCLKTQKNDLQTDNKIKSSYA